MPLINPVNLFDALDGTPQAGGSWKLFSASSWDGNLCTSADGFGYTNQAITPNVTLLAGGNDVVYVDFTGVSCGVSAEGDGTYVFHYTVGNGSCTATSVLTIDVIDNVVTIARYDEACVYHLDIVNPSTPTNISKKSASYNRVAPDIFLTNEWITPRLSYQARVTRTDLENCIAPNSVTMYTSNNTIGQLGTTFAANKPSGQSSATVDGPNVNHSISIDTSSWSSGAFIQSIKFYIGGAPVSVDFSYAVFASAPIAYAEDLQDGLIDAMVAVTGDNGLFNGSVTYGGGDLIKITMMCAHNVTGWCGINKDDVEVRLCLSGSCMGETCGVDGITCVYPEVQQSTGGLFTRFIGGLYTTPCGEDLSLDLSLCPNRNDIEFFDLSGCNYNTLALQDANGRGYYTASGEGFADAYKICQTQALSADSSNCPSPSYSWSPSGAGETIFADPDTPYVVTADCEECLDSSPEYCFPLANAIDANVLVCKEPSVNDTTVAMDVENSGCSAGTIDYSSVQFFDVDTFITPTYSGPSDIDLAIPADPVPSFYFMVYQVPDSLGRKSNFAVFSVRLFRSTGCCNELL